MSIECDGKVLLTISTLNSLPWDEGSSSRRNGCCIRWRWVITHLLLELIQTLPCRGTHWAWRRNGRRRVWECGSSTPQLCGQLRVSSTAWRRWRIALQLREQQCTQQHLWSLKAIFQTKESTRLRSKYLNKLAIFKYQWFFLTSLFECLISPLVVHDCVLPFVCHDYASELYTLPVIQTIALRPIFCTL